MRFKKTAALVGAALAAATFAAPPASATTATTTSLARCANGYVYAKASANLYSGWDSFRVVDNAWGGHVYKCSPGYKLGRRYTACGVSDGNGWLYVEGADHIWGYGAQACFIDQ